ncbi:hypothetical protein Bca4012_002782 [Brassica carinata]
MAMSSPSTLNPLFVFCKRDSGVFITKANCNLQRFFSVINNATLCNFLSSLFLI